MLEEQQCVMCAGNLLGDAGGRAVADKLENVPNLKVLDLSCTHSMESTLLAMCRISI